MIFLNISIYILLKESVSDAIKVKINLNDEFNNTTLTWSNVNVYAPAQKTGFFSCFKKTDETATKHILKDGKLSFCL